VVHAVAGELGLAAQQRRRRLRAAGKILEVGVEVLVLVVAERLGDVELEVGDGEA
jgi:hypothetical protein